MNYCVKVLKGNDFIKSLDYKLLGKTAFEYIKGEFNNIPVERAEKIEEVSSYDYVVYLFDDTFIVNKNDIEKAIGEYSVDLGGGFIIKKGEHDTRDFRKYDLKLIRVTDSVSLDKTYRLLKKKTNKSLMQKGVIMLDAKSTHIDATVEIEAGVIIHPNNKLYGDTKIKSGAILYPFNQITDSNVESGATIKCSVLDKAYIGKNTTVGPYAYLRPNSNIGENCRIGDFVEVKNAKIGNGSKLPHLSYVGDAEVGEKTNIGCGVIFANYNGKLKQKTFVGNNSFIGSNCNLVAPLKIGNKVFIAAGTTVTKDVNDEDFIVGRARPTTFEKGAKKYLD